MIAERRAPDRGLARTPAEVQVPPGRQDSTHDARRPMKEPIRPRHRLTRPLAAAVSLLLVLVVTAPATAQGATPQKPAWHALPAETITGAVVNFLKCFLDPDLFDRGLDFAVREWSRRDGAVRQRIDEADRDRLLAVTGMFARHGYSAYDADVRARILYYMQLGYHALDVREPMQARTDRVEGYLRGFTGQEPTPADIEEVRTFALAKDGRQ